MREDMSKVIVERPRFGSRCRAARRLHRLDPRLIELDEDADDPFPVRIGHARWVGLGRFRKCLNEHLGPLKRYLDGQVGRPWNDVFSEISEHIRLDNTVQKHVRDHIGDFVAITTFLRDGQIHTVDRFGRPWPLLDMRWPPGLYVHPMTGLLCRNDWRRARRIEQKREQEAAKRALAARMRVLEPMRQLHLLSDGNWWDVRLARVPAYVPHEDVIDRAGLSELPRDERYQAWGVYAVVKQALSRRRIKALTLRG
jgi:hypothetical protein